jgi:hypothetical protein
MLRPNAKVFRIVDIDVPSIGMVWRRSELHGASSIVERIVLGTKNDGNGFTFRWAACQSAETF